MRISPYFRRESMYIDLTQMIKDKLARKKTALQTIASLTAQSEDAYRKIKDSTRMLLTSLKRECKKVDDILHAQGQNE